MFPKKTKQPLVSAVLSGLLLVYSCNPANAGKNSLHTTVSKVSKALKKTKNATLRCVVTVNDALIHSFQELLCINDSGNGYEVLVYVELADMLNSLHLMDPLPPPSYTPEFTVNCFRAMNPDLWLRLGLDHLNSVHCGESCQETADYRVTVHMTRNRLALQSEQPGQPYLDIMLQDISGNEFSLSELPVVWLNSPEIVAALESISTRNGRLSLRSLASGLNEVRQIVGMMHEGQSENQLILAVKKARREGIDLGAYCDGDDDDLIDNFLKHNDDEPCLHKLVTTGSLPAKEKHLKTILGKRKRGVNTCYELHCILHNMERSGAHVEHFQTPQGNLVSWALMNDADFFALGAITGTHSYCSPVTLENLLQFLRRPWQPGEYQPYRKIPGEDKWESSIVSLFIDLLKKQNVAIASATTEHGNLADFVLKTRVPRYFELYDLYFKGMVEATMTQLFQAIEYAANGHREDLPLPVMWRLSQQGFDHKNWRSPQGETLVEVGQRLGAPAATLSILNSLTIHDTTPAPPRDYSARNSFDRKKRRVINRSPQANYEVKDRNAYGRSVRAMLKKLRYHAIDVEADGFCFYHALEAMFGIPWQRLKKMILRFLTAIKGRMYHAPLTAAQQSVLDWFGESGIGEAIWEMESDNWATHNLLIVVPHVLPQQLSSFPGLYVITPSSEGLATITHFTDQGPVFVNSIPDHTPVLVSNGFNHWSYATEMPEDMDTQPLMAQPLMDNSTLSNNTMHPSSLLFYPENNLPALPLLFE